MAKIDDNLSKNGSDKNNQKVILLTKGMFFTIETKTTIMIATDLIIFDQMRIGRRLGDHQ